MKKFDIHSHVLPGLDDGAADQKMSLQMVRMAAKQGVRRIIATPHSSPQFQSAEPARIRRMCSELTEETARRWKTPVHIYPGQEIFCTSDGMEKLKAGKLLTLADSRYVLVEFLPGAPYSELFCRVKELAAVGFVPVIAHVERYGALREDGRVAELIRAGARMQMNYRPIGEKWYAETTRWCRKMLKTEQIHFLGTDMHNTHHRRPDTEAAQQWMEKHLDRSYFRAICFRNAEYILKDEKL